MPPKGEGFARNAILALSKFRETFRTSRLKECLLILALGGVRGAVKECRRANTGVPVKILMVRSRIKTWCYLAESIITMKLVSWLVRFIESESRWELVW